MTTRTVCILRALAILALTPLLSHCGITNHLPTPSIPFTDIGKDTPIHDPQLSYDLHQKLTPGHTFDLSIFSGLRSPNRIFSGKTVINEEGNINLGKLGQIHLAGLDATTALRSINSLVIAKHGAHVTHVHLHSIEDLPLISITGAVKNPGIVRWFGSATTTNILPYVQGRTGNGSAVYITRNGRRHFYPSLHTADAAGSLQAGDIITYTGDL